jgi:hypothetical protein
VHISNLPLFTDASLDGLDKGNLKVKGRNIVCLFINILEMKAVLLAVESFLAHLRGKTVTLYSNNSVTRH